MFHEGYEHNSMLPSYILPNTFNFFFILTLHPLVAHPIYTPNSYIPKMQRCFLPSSTIMCSTPQYRLLSFSIFICNMPLPNQWFPVCILKHYLHILRTDDLPELVYVHPHTTQIAPLYLFILPPSPPKKKKKKEIFAPRFWFTFFRDPHLLSFYTNARTFVSLNIDIIFFTFCPSVYHFLFFFLEDQAFLTRLSYPTNFFKSSFSHIFTIFP